MIKMFHVIAVEDEKWALDRLCDMLEKMEQVTLIGRFNNSKEALEFVKNKKIDAAFLDITMPDINGLMLSELILNIDRMVDIVFVTGYEEYALQAFELSAIDYLLKPFSEARLKKTIDRLSLRRSALLPMVSKASVICLGEYKLKPAGIEKGEIKWRTQKAKELFAFLIHQNGKSVSRDTIITELWPDYSAEKALANLNANTYYLRKAMADAGIENCIQTSRYEIRLMISQIECDLYDFENIVNKYSTADSESIGSLKKAVSLYHGSYFKDNGYEWAYEKGRQLEQKYLKLLMKMAAFYQNCEYYYDSIEMLKKFLEIDILWEKAHKMVIKNYIYLGEKQAAIQQYNELKELFREELGIEPSKEIKQLIKDKS